MRDRQEARPNKNATIQTRTHLLLSVVSVLLPLFTYSPFLRFALFPLTPKIPGFDKSILIFSSDMLSIVLPVMGAKRAASSCGCWLGKARGDLARRRHQVPDVLEEFITSRSLRSRNVRPSFSSSGAWQRAQASSSMCGSHQQDLSLLLRCQPPARERDCSTHRAIEFLVPVLQMRELLFARVNLHHHVRCAATMPHFESSACV